MSETQLTETIQENQIDTGSLLLGAGLALASFIILPAVATRIGLGPSLTGAMRIALMKASAKASTGKSNDDGSDACTTGFSCH